MEDCLFCKIVRGEIKADKVYEDENTFAFLDLFPQCTGQTLVIPKKHVDYFLKMDEKEYLELHKTSKKIAQVLEKTLKPLRVCMIIEGFDVPHVHVKLFPTLKTEDLRAPRNRATPEQLQLIKNKIISNF